MERSSPDFLARQRALHHSTPCEGLVSLAYVLAALVGQAHP